jgi:hypothetical protein
MSKFGVGRQESEEVVQILPEITLIRLNNFEKRGALEKS